MNWEQSFHHGQGDDMSTHSSPLTYQNSLGDEDYLATWNANEQAGQHKAWSPSHPTEDTNPPNHA